MSRIPHIRVVVAISGAAIAGYAGFSVWALLYSNDKAIIGDVIGTWKSFGVAAVSFWLGSSSAGKAQSSDPRPHVDAA